MTHIIPEREQLREDRLALALRKLTFAYPRQNPILRALDLEIVPGERVGLIGPNGTGKTTLFLLICGVLKPTSGDIVLYDQEMRYGEFRPEIGLVFQNPDDQLFSPSVRDDIAFGPQNLGLSKTEVDIRIAESLRITNTFDLAGRPPHHLSGGEKRMVAIAGVLAMRPRFVIYDEPSSNLDIRARRRLIQFLQASSETLLIASHDLEFVLEVCSRVLLLDDGRIVADGAPRDVLGEDSLMRAHGLERPHSLVPHEIPHHG